MHRNFVRPRLFWLNVAASRKFAALAALIACVAVAAAPATALGAKASLVKDIYPGHVSSSPRYMTRVGRTIFFSAWARGTGYELWKVVGG